MTVLDWATVVMWVWLSAVTGVVIAIAATMREWEKEWRARHER